MEEVLIFTGDSAEPPDREMLDGDTREKHRATKVARVRIDVLRRNLQDLLESIETLLPPPETDAKRAIRLKEFEVSVGVNGKGEVGFLGTGVEVGGEASLKLVFSRQ